MECLSPFRLQESVVGGDLMRIGVIGTGNMGRALGLRWARRGHQVLFGSRDPNKAKVVAAAAVGSATVGDLDEAAAFGETEIGFVGVDCGELERARLVEAAADLVRFFTLGMGHGPLTTISINLLREA
jgi:predicted dinucleotide-binding enzyme